MTSRDELTRRLFLRGAAALTVTAGTSAVTAEAASATEVGAQGTPGVQPIQVFCGVGDHLWTPEREPVDSVATVNAMFEWMSQTYDAQRMYWRALRPWAEWMKVGNSNVSSLQNYDWSQNWLRWLELTKNIDAAAVTAAHSRGMEIFFYTGLFEFGVQPDVGVIYPYPFEDQLRRDHPEWIPTDRWGQRRSPGPISFSYPAARAAVINRLAQHVIQRGYDGVNFYTYVENLGIRYLDEFGFNQPIVDLFNQTYPTVDLRTDVLTPTQKEHWYFCRGKFVTDFLRELYAALAPAGIKLSMTLDSLNPDYVQPSWGKTLPGTGMIHMDWEQWIDEGIVDEIWVQLGTPADQEALLDQLLVKVAGTPIKLTVRTPFPYDTRWDPYVSAGVTVIAVITWAQNGIERISLAATSLATLSSPDWKVRVQTLENIAAKKITGASPAAVAVLTTDPHVLVRRKAARALAEIAATGHVADIEALLLDPETSVRIAAGLALTKVHGPNTAAKLIAALEDTSLSGGNALFQLKSAATTALLAIGVSVLPLVQYKLQTSSAGVREVCIRVLAKLGGASDIAGILETSGNAWVRSWAIHRWTSLAPEMSQEDQWQLVDSILDIIQTEANITTQLHAVDDLALLVPFATPAQKATGLAILEALFGQFGDNSSRADAAYGWRIVGNTIVAWGGRDSILDPMRAQTLDTWLAWNAYEVMYLKQERTFDFNLVDEAQAIAEHNQYAPVFPGWRTW